VVGTADLVHAAFAGKAQGLWRQASFSVHSQIVEGPGFWQTAEIEEVPALVAATLGVVVVVGGPQYRAGSHRQFVLLCRALAAAGVATLRFDYRGMGDSSGEHRDFNDASADIAAAIDALQRHLPSVTRVCLWGLCDGASAALLYCQDTGDRRVSGQPLGPLRRKPGAGPGQTLLWAAAAASAKGILGQTAQRPGGGCRKVRWSRPGTFGCRAGAHPHRA